MNISTQFEKYQGRGLSGLYNLGNTCYLNTCLQILSHTYELTDLLDSKIFRTKLNKNNDSVILLEWDSLRQLLWSQNGTVSPDRFVDYIRKIAKHKGEMKFVGYEQNDVSEFLIFLIDIFHNALKREVTMSIQGNVLNDTDDLAMKCYQTVKNMYSKEYSEIWNMFYAVHVSQIKSVATNEVISTTPEPYFTINLCIPENNKTPDLLECFNLYIEGETIEGYKNEKSGQLETIKKQVLFWSFPNILVIDFKRFFMNERKNQICVHFPLENLDLSKYVIGYNNTSYVYDLYGICNHSGGSARGGHYYAHIKNANGKWYNINDTKVTEINESALITPKAYCLFYRKKTIS
jgi:ubiquitin C-terminal hydrolase